MATKRLYRSRKDRMVAGVAGGLGEYFGIDPTLIRLGWVLLLIPGGLPGLLPYILCWIIIPREPVAGALLPEQAASTRPIDTPPATTGATLPDVTPPPTETDGEARER
jgi:phage shock protein PspC (stress-responsive transcriptional regulator)